MQNPFFGHPELGCGSQVLKKTRVFAALRRAIWAGEILSPDFPICDLLENALMVILSAA
jgi:hypothetical protein